VGLLLGLYPRAWRERYGDEFAALLEEMGIGPAAVLDVVCGAVDAHVRQRASERAAKRAQQALVIGGKVTMGVIAGIVLAVLVWAFAVTIEGGDVTAYLLPSPLILVVGGTLAALLIGYGGVGFGRLPGLLGSAFRGAAQVADGAADEAAARYQLGTRMFQDAGLFALLSGVIATLLGVVIVLSTLGETTARFGHGVAVSLTGFLYGFVVAIFCYAVSANLREKGERVDGTLRAVRSAAETRRQVGTAVPLGAA
jgi:hypothetical protein